MTPDGEGTNSLATNKKSGQAGLIRKKEQKRTNSILPQNCRSHTIVMLGGSPPAADFVYVAREFIPARFFYAKMPTSFLLRLSEENPGSFWNDASIPGHVPPIPAFPVSRLTFDGSSFRSTNHDPRVISSTFSAVP